MRKELIDKFNEIEATIAGQRGPFNLFGLFLREEGIGKWDVVAAADWITRENNEEGYRRINDQIQARLTLEELLQVSRIVIIHDDNPGLEALYDAYDVEHGRIEIYHRPFFGMDMQHVILMTSKRPSTRKATQTQTQAPQELQAAS